MGSIDVPIKVQLGCDECYRFLLAERAKHEAEVARLRDAVSALEGRGKTYPPLHMALRIDELEAALEAIRGPDDGSPWAATYREAGGGYEGLQAIARAALGDES